MTIEQKPWELTIEEIAKAKLSIVIAVNYTDSLVAKAAQHKLVEWLESEGYLGMDIVPVVKCVLSGVNWE